MKLKIERKLNHNKKRLQELKTQFDKIGVENLTYYGGRDIGYLQGKVAALEDILDEFNETTPNN